MPDTLCSIHSNQNSVAVLALPGSHKATARQVLESVQRQLFGLAANKEVKGIILAGSSAGFCNCLLEDCQTPSQAADLSAFGQMVMFSLEKAGKPCIAVIEGDCSGLGFEVALACDFIVAARNARFGFPAIAAGRIPFCGGSQRLTKLVGKSMAKELIFSGDLIDAEEAHRIGLTNRLYRNGETLAKAEELLAHICTRSPNAIRIGSEVINAGFDIDLQTACMLERNAFALCFSSFDQREGMQAFLDKRQPQFKGE